MRGRCPWCRGVSAALPWRLLGVHSARMDMGDRDLVLDESLGLNCAWYADILLTLTERTPAVTVEPVAPAKRPAGSPRLP